MATAAIIAAAIFLRSTEQHIATARAAERAFDSAVGETTRSVAEFREGAVTASIDMLRSMATTDQARTSLDQAALEAQNFTEIATVLNLVNAARMAEQRATDDNEVARRRLEAGVLGGTALISLLAIVGILIATPKAESPVAGASSTSADATAASRPGEIQRKAEPDAPPGHLVSRPAGPVLRAASQLCTDLGRARNAEELDRLMARAADLMDASGLIVWTSAADGSRLLPALSHGYSPDVLSRIPPLARSANNAAAGAFRTGQLQIVAGRPGEANGAVVAPVLSPAGCVGVISAEIRGGGETSESVQAMASIFAAQLSGVLLAASEARQQRATGT